MHSVIKLWNAANQKLKCILEFSILNKPSSNPANITGFYKGHGQMPLSLQLWYKYCILYQTILFQYGSTQRMEEADVPISPHTPKPHTQTYTYTVHIHILFLFNLAYMHQYNHLLLMRNTLLQWQYLASSILGVIISNISDWNLCIYLFSVL